MLELRRVDLGQDDVPEGEITTAPIIQQRGFIAVPTGDVENYVRSQFVTFAAGFVLGMAGGALVGNLFAKRGPR